MTRTDLTAANPASPDPVPPAPAGAANGSRTPRAAVVAVAAVLAVGIIGRFTIKSDLWLDEALSVNIAHLPVREIPHWLRHDGAPPLYYLLLHYWSKAFGNSDLDVRSLSGLFSVATLPLAWYCGKRVGGRATAWVAVLVLASNPFAVEYATSARMYAMEMFLVFAGILAVRRAFDRPSIDRLALVALVTALLIYTQYWGIYLGIAVGLFLAATAQRAPKHREAALRLLGALAVGAVTFAPWLPTFLYQAKHTGTPWGQAQFPPTPIGLSLQDFSGGATYEGWILFLTLIVLVVIGVFGATVDGRHIDLDLHTQPGARWEAAVGALGLIVGTSLAWLSGSAFQSRYAAIVFPFFVLVVARGITRFGDPKVRVGVLALVVAVGLAGCARNDSTNRTEAGEVAAILRKNAAPGDIVLYCPDQLGPAVHRLVQPGLDEMTYPLLAQPGLVNWVNYKAILAAHKPATVAKAVLALAGSHTIWYVSAPGYRTHVTSCIDLADTLGESRADIDRLNSDTNFYEKPGLQEFPAR